MQWLRLGWVTGPSPTLRAAWQDVAATPAPLIPGLLARQWQLDRSQLEGCYLFARPADLEAFLADPDADPAFARLSRKLGTGAEARLPVRVGGEPPRLGPALFI